MLKCLNEQLIIYYVNRGSHVFSCFVDYTEAFDSVNYWKKLFNKLLDDKIDINIVSILCYWYTNQELCIRWLASMSSFFYRRQWDAPMWYFICLADIYENCC